MSTEECVKVLKELFVNNVQIKYNDNYPTMSRQSVHYYKKQFEKKEGKEYIFICEILELRRKNREYKTEIKNLRKERQSNCHP